MAAALFGGVSIYLLVAMFLRVAPKLELPERQKPQIGKRQLWLIQAGSDLTPRQFNAGAALIGFVAFLVLLVLTGGWHLALAPAIAIGTWPRFHYGRIRQKRLAAVQRAWPDGLRDLLAHVASGSTLPKAVEALAEGGPEPLRFAFERFPLQARMFGVPTALEIVKEELSDPTSDKVIEVLALAHEYGGELVQDVLRDLTAAINEDLRTLEDIKVADFEQQIESWLVVIVPWAVLLYLATVPDQYRAFYTSAAGRGIVILGMIWTGFGVLLLRFIGRQRREERVLGGAAAVSDDKQEVKV